MTTQHASPEPSEPSEPTQTKTLYKLTDANGCTRGGTQWGEGVTHSASGFADQDLCTNGWIHAYEHPLLAVFLNPIGGDFSSPQLWEARGIIGMQEGLLKCGCRTLTTIRRPEIPQVTTTQCVAFGILSAKEVINDAAWNLWADAWLNGKDRTVAKAREAGAAARAVMGAWARASVGSQAARAGVWVAAAAAAGAAVRAAEAWALAATARVAAKAWATAGSRARETTATTREKAAAAAAMEAAAAAAAEAAWAVWEAVRAEASATAKPLDLIAIAEKAMTYTEIGGEL